MSIFQFLSTSMLQYCHAAACCAFYVGIFKKLMFHNNHKFWKWLLISLRYTRSNKQLTLELHHVFYFFPFRYFSGWGKYCLIHIEYFSIHVDYQPYPPPKEKYLTHTRAALNKYSLIFLSVWIWIYVYVQKFCYQWFWHLCIWDSIIIPSNKKRGAFSLKKNVSAYLLFFSL